MAKLGARVVPHESPTEVASTSQDHRVVRRCCRQAAAVVGIVSFVVFALSPVITNYDSYSTFPSAVSLVNHQTLSLNEFAKVPTLTHSYTVSRLDGRLVTKYPWMDSLFFVPSVVAIDALHVLGGPSAYSLVANNDMGIVQMETASFVTALACAVMTWLAFARFAGTAHRRRKLAIVCGLVLAFGTAAWSIASRSLWQHGPSLLLLALGLVVLNRLLGRRGSERQQRRDAALTGALFALALTVRPTDAVPLVVVGVVFVFPLRRWLLLFIAGAAVILLAWILLTHIAYGSPFQPYFTNSGLAPQSASLEALAANLFSPARGLIIFSPIVLAAIGGVIVAARARSLMTIEWVCLGVIPLYWFVVSCYGPLWWAGNTYGPRFMTDTLPFIFVLALPLVEWLWGPQERFSVATTRSGFRTTVLVATVALVVLSVAFNAEGGVLRSTTCWNGTPVNVDHDPSRSLVMVGPAILDRLSFLARRIAPLECVVHLCAIRVMP